MVTEHVLSRVAEVCTSFLDAVVDEDWSSPVPDLALTVAGVVAHAAEGSLWYAIDLSARGRDLSPVEHRVRPDEPPDELIATVATHTRVLGAVVTTTPSDARGFHPMGSADPSGFAAMGCDELLIHTDDAARGLGLTFSPPPDLAAAVLARLFPWVDAADDPWQALRWANGRIALDGRPRLEGWAWHCAPLAEWDGTVPTLPTRPAQT